MPTGYTAYIENGDITTGKDFLKLCTRNFGIAIDMRDESLSVPTQTHFEPNSYYKKEYDKAVEVCNKYRHMTFDEVKQEMIKSYNDRIASAKKCLEDYKSEDEKYKKIRDEIVKWNPPTDEHDGLKKFALEQIDISMNTSYYKYLEDDLNKELDISDKAVYTYMNDINESYEKDVEMVYRRWQEELKRTAEKNLWMQQFIDSLENI